VRKVLVTGSNGFVGSTLCAELQTRNVSHVRAVRNKSAKEEIAVGSFQSGSDWSMALEGCDVVIHLAARVHMMREQGGDRLSDYRVVNVDATLNLARQALSRGVKRFVFVSSIKVNGEQTSGLRFSALDPAAPSDPYGLSKHEAELALLALASSSEMEVVIVRPPLVYGPGVRANFLRLLQLVRLNIPLPFGRINNRRSMVSVGNLVNFLIVCASHPAAAGNTFLISDDHDVSIAELITLMARAMGRKPRLFPVPESLLRLGAVAVGKSSAVNRLLESLQVDITPAKSLLGWTPVESVEDAVARTTAHFCSDQGTAL
jgi:nucleoside-diphosphate-sugar epimerase